MSTLAMIYIAQGRYADAEQVETRALDITIRSFGPSHSRAGKCLSTLAFLRYKQEQYLPV
jgi:hypothetical protein